VFFALNFFGSIASFDLKRHKTTTKIIATVESDKRLNSGELPVSLILLVAKDKNGRKHSKKERSIINT
jgi:hypothetical protein